MSRIGKRPIVIPAGVKVEISKVDFSASGPKGKLTMRTSPQIKIIADEKEVRVEKNSGAKDTAAIWGTTVRLIENIFKGITEGFQKQLELNGVGYRMAVVGKKINLALGFSHPVEVEVEDGIEVKIENNVMTVSGIDKQRVGQFAADIKALKPVEPYKGKGFRYVGEFVRRKEGKKAGA